MIGLPISQAYRKSAGFSGRSNAILPLNRIEAINPKWRKLCPVTGQIIDDGGI